MNADYRKIVQSVQQRQFAPFYIVDGEEPFYADRLVTLFEEHILTEAERDFNLIVLYGRETGWADVVNACRRFPMFAERQVVILREAAQLRDLNALAGYLEHPAPTTVLLIDHRGKKVDGRGKLAKLAKDKGFYFTSDKIKDDQLPGWIQAYGKETGIEIPEKEAQLLAAHLGSDLQKIANELEKVRINAPGEATLTAAMIQKYIGISREYNIFEYPEALTSNNRDKLYRMLAYFSAQSKAAPMPLVIGAFYSHFSKLYQACFLEGRPPRELSGLLNAYGERLNAITNAVRRYRLAGVQECLGILAEYSAYAVGFDSTLGDASLLREMTARLLLVA